MLYEQRGVLVAIQSWRDPSTCVQGGPLPVLTQPLEKRLALIIHGDASADILL